MKNCNRCGKFRSQKTHVCLPVKVMKSDGKTVAYTFTMNQKKKSLHSSKKISKTTTKSRLWQGTSVMLLSLALSWSGFTALANADSISNTVTYQQTVPTTSTSTPINAPKTKVESVESIKEKILRYSLKYDVSPVELENIVKCETGAVDVNKASTTIRSRYLEGTPRHEKSWGLVQIHVSKVAVSYEDAINPDFALEYLAKNWKAGNQWMWKNCSLKYGYL